MLTDHVPRRRDRRDEYVRSDAMRDIVMAARLRERIGAVGSTIRSALEAEDIPAVSATCGELSRLVCEANSVEPAEIEVLASRPRRVYRDGATTELFGDYEMETGRIRVWMRTAVQKKVTSYGTFMSTLCHELMHHLDVHGLGFHNTYHTRGFYERTAAIYHAAKGEPVKRIVWVDAGRGRYRVDWKGMRRPVLRK